MFSCEFCEISKNTFLHRTPPVAASERFFQEIDQNAFKKRSPTGLDRKTIFSQAVLFKYIYRCYLSSCSNKQKDNKDNAFITKSLQKASIMRSRLRNTEGFRRF